MKKDEKDKLIGEVIESFPGLIHTSSIEFNRDRIYYWERKWLHGAEIPAKYR